MTLQYIGAKTKILKTEKTLKRIEVKSKAILLIDTVSDFLYMRLKRRTSIPYCC